MPHRPTLSNGFFAVLQALYSMFKCQQFLFLFLIFILSDFKDLLKYTHVPPPGNRNVCATELFSAASLADHSVPPAPLRPAWWRESPEDPDLHFPSGKDSVDVHSEQEREHQAVRATGPLPCFDSLRNSRVGDIAWHWKRPDAHVSVNKQTSGRRMCTSHREFSCVISVRG